MKNHVAELFCRSCGNKTLCWEFSDKLSFCKTCLLFGVREIRKKEIKDCPAGLMVCFKCGQNLDPSKFQKKKNGDMKTWCVDCCLGESERLKKSPRCVQCGYIAPVGNDRCRKCIRKNSGG